MVVEMGVDRIPHGFYAFLAFLICRVSEHSTRSDHLLW